MISTYHLSRHEVHGARAAVRARLYGQRIDLVDTAELLTSEVVTNALVHGSDEAVMTIDVGRETLRVEVEDPDGFVDLRPIHPGPTSEHGRGLQLVDALATSWGVEARNLGKVVWFELRL